MAKDDYFKIVYAILTELYASMKSGEKLVPETICPERFGIHASYWMDILGEMKNEGHIRGVTFVSTKTGRYLVSGWQDSIQITAGGIEYLTENSMMKKMYQLAKEVRDWIPGY